MKILAVTLKNLNSLRGTWNIDLTHNDYVSNGIFAVTGRTGAGKTTIFDAVCLALYAQTPRLGRIDGRKNEIMSKHTNDCGAKVKFEADGKIYVCEWTQERIYGKFQTKHSVSLNGVPINDSQKQRETISLITQITGMDFKRFVQAMLLEQGEFDRFLNADKNNRGEVLELITGTGIYSEISRRVFQRNKDEHKALDAKLNELEAERLRSGAVSAESIQAEISEREKEISQADEKHKATILFRNWHNDIKHLNDAIQQVEADIAAQERRTEAFESDRKILEAAERAGTLEGIYSTLSAKRDSKLSTEKLLAKASNDISSQQAALSQILTELPRLNDELARLKGQITEPPAAVFARIEAAAKNYARKKSDISQAEKALRDSQLRLQKAQAHSLRAVSEGKSARSRMNEAGEKYKRIFDLTISTRAKTVSAVLDHERGKLIEGTPCPLCGSTSHPMTAHTDTEISAPNPEGFFRETERLEAELQKAKAELDEAEKYFYDVAVANWNKASAAESAEEAAFKNCNENLSALKNELKLLEEALIEAVSPLRISDISDTKKVLDFSQSWVKNVDAIEKRIEELKSRKSPLEESLKILKAHSETLSSGLEALNAELSVLESSFSEKLGQMNFNDEESFRLSLNLSSDEIESIKRRKFELDSMTERLKGALSNLKKQLDEKISLNLTEHSSEEIESLYRDEESTLRRLHENIGVLSQKLDEFHRSSEKIKQLEEEYSSMKKTADDWALLNDLIGSAKGNKFRVHAQKITLALVVENANKYLQRMNGRYTLVLTPESDELGLSVKDSEQAGEIRPTTNLSGGEKFIVSLALALGLSQISGSKAQVDSLFIDEGFGSLDDEALNSALEALGEIKRDGRMIGVISHVAGISERINAQIHVIRKSEGSSIIEGPGCSGGYK